MRRLHNRHLHTQGIVWGLDVKVESGKVVIEPGMAINTIGGSQDEGNENEDISQEIVLSEPATVPLSTAELQAGVYIYIYHKKEAADVVQDRGGTDKIHWVEKAVIDRDTNRLNIKESDGEIILAWVQIIAGVINVSYFDKDGKTPLRTYAGAYGKLTLSIENETYEPLIEGKKIDGKNGILVTSPLTSFTGALSITGGIKGDLRVDGKCTITGDLDVEGVTTTINTATLEVEDNIIRVNKYTGTPKPINIKGGLEVFRGGIERNAQIIWDETAGHWKIGLENRTDLENNLFDVAYGDNWTALTNNSVVNTLHKHSKLVSADGAVDPALSVDNSGNVGIGTPNPQDKLDMSSGAIRFYSGTDYQRILANTWGLNIFTNKLVNSGLRVGEIYGGLGLYAGDGATAYHLGLVAGSGMGVGIAGNAANPFTGNGLFVASNGNVGIGTTNPLDKLDLSSGSIRFYSGTDYQRIFANTWGVNIFTNKLLNGRLRVGEIYGGLGLYAGDGATAYHLGLVAGSGMGVGIAGNAANPFTGNGLLVASNGNVGIGTTAPSERLEVNGTVKAAAFIGDGSLITNLPIGQWFINTKGIYYDKGFVGIGTNSPGANLEVKSGESIFRASDLAPDDFIKINATNEILTTIHPPMEPIQPPIIVGPITPSPSVVSTVPGVIPTGLGPITSATGPSVQPAATGPAISAATLGTIPTAAIGTRVTPTSTTGTRTPVMSAATLAAQPVISTAAASAIAPIGTIGGAPVAGGAIIQFYEANTQKANLWWKRGGAFLINSIGSTNTSINPNGGNVGIGTVSPSVRLSIGGTGANVYSTDAWIENNMHVQGNETLAQGGRGRMRVGTAWGYMGLYADPSSTGVNNDLVLGASSGTVRIGPDTLAQNLKVSGSVTVAQGLKVFGTKNFITHHPLDPENKYLIHTTLEGPENAVFYRGEAELSEGRTTIQLPDYFEALTRKENRTVLITPKFEGDSPVSMLAASEVDDGKFDVKMVDRKNPSQKFYWEVKAVRGDIGILDVEEQKLPAQ
ncbi:MAG: hypothetical protein O8C62_02895 [Candidatus Methanoperedens sp.]|nr:hypothetical protein [Candidatus Methanoperedens sp.]